MDSSIEKISAYLLQLPPSVLLFSGGFGSSALLGVAKKCNAPITPLWINNGFNRCHESEIFVQAERLGCQSLQMVMMTPSKEVCANGSDRCLNCQTQIVGTIKRQGIAIIDGVTMDAKKQDAHHAKMVDIDVKSPLLELEIPERQVREMALFFGADERICRTEQCLASRFSHGCFISHDRLTLLRNVENLLIAKTHDYGLGCILENNSTIKVVFSHDDSFSCLLDKDLRRQLADITDEVGMELRVDILTSGLRL